MQSDESRDPEIMARRGRWVEIPIAPQIVARCEEEARELERWIADVYGERGLAALDEMLEEYHPTRNQVTMHLFRRWVDHTYGAAGLEELDECLDRLGGGCGWDEITAHIAARVGPVEGVVPWPARFPTEGGALPPAPFSPGDEQSN
jgi:hypothetical protein